MLIPVSTAQLSRLIPSVATGNQFKYALGDPRKILQRLIISVIGGVINFLLSGQLYGSQTSSFWLVLSVLFFLYILWGPILEASRKNAKFKKYEFFSILEETKSNGNYSLSDACNILINNQDLGGVNIDDSVWLDIDTPEALDYIKKNRKLFKE